MRLSGKSVIVTGGGGGIGRAVCLRFAREGARVVVSDIDDDAAEAVVADIQDGGGIAEQVHCDVLDIGQIRNLVDSTIKTFGQVDILVNNAGGAIVAGDKLPLYDTPQESVRRMLDVNLMGTVWCTHAVVGHMKERRAGRIVSMSSVAGLVGGTPAMYATAKAAIVALTKSVAVEMAEFGVTANCISPWAIATRDGPAALPKRIPKLGSAEDVANLALFLVSKEADFITGSNYVIDGGYTSGTW